MLAACKPKRCRVYLPLAATAVLFVAAGNAAAQENPQQVRTLIKAYIERHNSHDLAGVMDLYAENAVFYLSMGRPPVSGREAITDLERFDVAAQSTIYPQGITAQRDGEVWRVHIDGAIEHSEIFEAAGAAIVRAQGIQNAFVLRDGKIIEIHQPDLVSACSGIVLEAFRGLVSWLAETGDPRQDRLVANGFINLTPETIPDIVIALREWRERTSSNPDPATVSACAAFDP